ncbi:hypothetical protein HK102_001529 [Quaeritorhiza haematococci]|nr:hypothetical protein HK102_001529 [Quaeritorhiza haematococci]
MDECDQDRRRNHYPYSSWNATASYAPWSDTEGDGELQTPEAELEVTSGEGEETGYEDESDEDVTDDEEGGAEDVDEELAAVENGARPGSTANVRRGVVHASGSDSSSATTAPASKATVQPPKPMTVNSGGTNIIQTTLATTVSSMRGGSGRGSGKSKGYQVRLREPSMSPKGKSVFGHSGSEASGIRKKRDVKQRQSQQRNLKQKRTEKPQEQQQRNRSSSFGAQSTPSISISLDGASEGGANGKPIPFFKDGYACGLLKGLQQRPTGLALFPVVCSFPGEPLMEHWPNIVSIMHLHHRQLLFPVHNSHHSSQIPQHPGPGPSPSSFGITPASITAATASGAASTSLLYTSPSKSGAAMAGLTSSSPPTGANASSSRGMFGTSGTSPTSPGLRGVRRLSNASMISALDGEGAAGRAGAVGTRSTKRRSEGSLAVGTAATAGVGSSNNPSVASASPPVISGDGGIAGDTGASERYGGGVPGNVKRKSFFGTLAAFFFGSAASSSSLGSASAPVTSLSTASKSQPPHQQQKEQTSSGAVGSIGTPSISFSSTARGAGTGSSGITGSGSSGGGGGIIGTSPLAGAGGFLAASGGLNSLNLMGKPIVFYDRKVDATYLLSRVDRFTVLVAVHVSETEQDSGVTTAGVSVGVGNKLCASISHGKEGATGGPVAETPTPPNLGGGKSPAQSAPGTPSSSTSFSAHGGQGQGQSAALQQGGASSHPQQQQQPSNSSPLHRHQLAASPTIGGSGRSRHSLQGQAGRPHIQATDAAVTELCSKMTKMCAHAEVLRSR